MSAALDGDFVVFLIGARINKPWKIHKWVPVFLAMPRLLRDVNRHQEAGLIGFQAFPGLIVQYWRSFDHLETYARDNDEHRAAWAQFYKRVGIRDGDVGIWHETYLVPAGQFEAFYANMPTFGLAAAGRTQSVTENTGSARQRLDNPH